MTSAGRNDCWANDESAFRTRWGRFLVGMTTLISTTQFLVLRGCTAVADSTFNSSSAATLPSPQRPWTTRTPDSASHPPSAFLRKVAVSREPPGVFVVLIGTAGAPE